MELPASIEIDVTQDDINRGVHGGTSCPINLSASRSFRNLDCFTSWRSIRVIRPDGGYVYYDLPPTAQTFIDSFDLHGSTQCKPFRFTAARQ